MIKKRVLIVALIAGLLGCGSHTVLVQPPKIAQHDFAELSKIDALKVHWIKDSEQNQFLSVLTYIPRSEFKMPKTVEIYIPIDGTIVSINPAISERPLENVTLIVQSTEEPTWLVEIRGIDLNTDEWGPGKIVKAGMHIGYVHSGEDGLYASICVMHQENDKKTSHLFLNITADYVFKHYQLRNIQERESINPLTLNPNLNPSANDVFEFKLQQ